MILAALLLVQAAVAPAAAPACPATPARLPADLAGWSASAQDLSSMQAVTVPTSDISTPPVADVPPPNRAGRVALVPFRVKTGGTYGVALGSKGWIDVYSVGGRTPLVSTTHGHGQACSGITKIVRFALTPGDYRVVVSGLEGATTKLLLIKGQ